MFKRLRPKLTYANVISTICLFILLGGGAYAASKQLPKNSVGTKQLKKNAVTGDKVKNGSLTGADINASTLGTVPKATSADSASKATSATKADNSDQLGGAGASAYIKGADAVAGGDLTGTYASPTLKSSEGLHFVGGPAFEFCDSGSTVHWQNWGSTFGSAAYYRDQLGIVHLSGTVKCPGQPAQNGKAIFVLPAGFRPPSQYLFATVRGGSLASISVNNIGTVGFSALEPPIPAANETVNLNGVDFRCAPSGVNGCP